MSASQPIRFVDRRNQQLEDPSVGSERRQFSENRDAMEPDVRELAAAIDAYKLARHRRYITLAEFLDVVKSLGYHK